MPSVVSLTDFRMEGREVVEEGVGSGVVWDRCAAARPPPPAPLCREDRLFRPPDVPLWPAAPEGVAAALPPRLQREPRGSSAAAGSAASLQQRRCGRARAGRAQLGPAPRRRGHIITNYHCVARLAKDTTGQEARRACLPRSRSAAACCSA